jgi:hypothetical protein
MSTWQRANVIEQVLREWTDSGPSKQASQCLQKLFGPTHLEILDESGSIVIDESAGNVVVDAIMLHLIDHGRYSTLVKDYIDSLKRTGDYEDLISTLLNSYQAKDREWAVATVDKLFNTWDQSQSSESGQGDEVSISPGVTFEQKLKKFHQLMNPDARIGDDDHHSIEHHDADTTEQHVGDSDIS